jgi:transposase
MAASDYVPIFFKNRLHLAGRPQMTVPGIGPISATAIAALAPPAETFAKGRDFAAWLGLTPLQRSTGGKQKHPKWANARSDACSSLAVAPS